MKLAKSILIIVLLSFSSSHIFSQNNYNFSQFRSETGEFLKKPFNWQTDDFVKLGAVLGGTYALMHIDESVRTEMLKDTSWRGSVPLEFGRYWGEPVPSILLSAALLIHGSSVNNKANKKLGFEIAQAFLYTTSINGSLKLIFGRARPSTGLDAFSFKPLQSLENRNWSLPSGHTTIAFSLSTVLAANTDLDVLKVASFIPAFVTAFSRVNYNRHWVSDVFLGGISGYFIARYVIDTHEKKESSFELHETQTPLFSLSLQF